MKKQLTQKQFIFMMFNYIVGFGFISTIGSVISLKVWGIAVFFLTSIIAIGVLLIFSRLAQEYPDVEGSSYGFAKEAHGKKIIFFQGWNQFIQGPVLSASTPVFLEAILSSLFPSLDWLWITLSIILYFIFIFFSTLVLKKSYKIIKYISSIKWIIIGVAVGIIIWLAIKDANYSTNWIGSNKTTVSMITASTLLFIYAFGGIEGVTTLTKDTKAKSWRKIYLYVYFGLLAFYFLVYILMSGINYDNLTNDSQIFREIYNMSFGIIGTIFFTVGIIANKSSSIIGASLINARNLGPMAKDGYLPKWIGEEKHGVYVKGTYLSAAISIIIMIIFQVLRVTTSQNNPFFDMVAIGTIAFLFQYLFTGITLLKLFYTKKVKKIPVWEQAIYYIMFLVIFFVLLTQLIPPITGDKFTTSTIVKDVSYLFFIGLGYLTWWLTNLKEKKRKKA